MTESLYAVPGAGPPTIRDESDVLAVLSTRMREREEAPVRDALVQALLQFLRDAEFRGDQALAQVDILRAVDTWLDGMLLDAGFQRATGELDEEARERAFSFLETVSHSAIVGAVNGLLAPRTSVGCQLVEATLDQWFMHDGTFEWSAFLGTRSYNGFSVGLTPDYPDRIYEEPGIADDTTIGNNDPLGSRVWGDPDRRFLLLVPDLSFVDDAGWFLLNGAETDAEALAVGSFVYDNPTDASAFVYDSPDTSNTVYAAIISQVDALAGASVRWDMHAEF